MDFMDTAFQMRLPPYKNADLSVKELFKETPRYLAEYDGYTDGTINGFPLPLCNHNKSGQTGTFVYVLVWQKSENMHQHNVSGSRCLGEDASECCESNRIYISMKSKHNIFTIGSQ